MIVPDLNLLLHAYNTASSDHRKAREWWTRCMEGDDVVGLPAVVGFGFVRMITNRNVFTNPMAYREAVSYLNEWLDRPNVVWIERTYRDRVLMLLEQVGTAGNLVTDAQIAAVAIEEGGVVHTADAHFSRFSQLRRVNPLNT